MKIILNGMEDTQKQLKRIERGAAKMNNFQAQVGSALPYAWGIEFGRHRKSGKLARRKGGAFYITSAINTVTGDMDRDISEGLNKVTAPGTWVLRRLGLWARRLSRVNVPKGPKSKGHSYRLKRSIRYRVVSK